jgi:hypothetical protein
VRGRTQKLLTYGSSNNATGDGYLDGRVPGQREDAALGQERCGRRAGKDLKKNWDRGGLEREAIDKEVRAVLCAVRMEVKRARIRCYAQSSLKIR